MEPVKRRERVIFILLVGFFTVVLLKTAWVSDDAYITFRSIENFIHGYGMVHNVGERVQTFTHPLWFFIQAGANFILQKGLGFDFWSQMYYVNILLSISLSLLTVAGLIYQVSKSVQTSSIVVAVLISSKAFLDYSTSGLENPLTHLLLVAFYIIYFEEKLTKERKILVLSFIGCLASLNRLDTILFFIPPLVYLFFKNQASLKKMTAIITGFIPLLIWEIFSLFYYGALFPNTAYAKLNTGISRLSSILQGLKYYQDSILTDPITLIVIIGCVILILNRKSSKQLPFLISIFLYLFYILTIGGDFMSGRYFSAVLVLSVAIISFEISGWKWKKQAVILLLVLGYGLINPYSPLRAPLQYGREDFRHYINEDGIADERAIYYSYLGLFSTEKRAGFPGSKFSGEDWIYKENSGGLVVLGPLGIDGYALGPNTHVIDKNALADPLMARLPLDNQDDSRIGHFRHIIPEGYFETLETGRNEIENPNIATYYDRIKLIVRGELFDIERLKEIINLNLGRYDHLVEIN